MANPQVPSTNLDNGLSPQVNKDLKALLEAQEKLNEDRQLVKKLALMLHSMKNPMLGIQEIMGAIMTVNGDRVAGLSAVDSLDSDLRSEVSTGQDELNGMANGKDGVANAKKLIAFVKQMQAFIDEQTGLGKKAVVDKADLTNLQSALTNIKGAFSNWGDASKMSSQASGWVKNSKKNGTYDPAYKNVMDGFQTLNQSTSALSTATNTKLQFVTEQYKQFMGIFQSSNESWLKMTQADVSNQKSY